MFEGFPAFIIVGLPENRSSLMPRVEQVPKQPQMPVSHRLTAIPSNPHRPALLDSPSPFPV